MSYLLEFYGEECPNCVDMEPLVEKLEKELSIKVKKYEIWHNEENSKLMDKYDKNFCGGVPFFYNTKTNKWICGSTDYEKLKKWAMD